MKEKGISFLTSLLFHIFVLFVLIRIIPPVRVYVFRLAADVRIVEPGTISFPRIAGITETPSSESISSQISSENRSLQGTGASQQVELSPGIVYLKNLHMGRIDTRTAEDFDLIPSAKSEGKFSLAIGRKAPQYEKKRNKGILATVDFSAFEAPALSSLRFNRVITDKKGITPTGGIEISHQLEDYGLEPWIKQVVDKIRNNWTPVPIDESIAIGKAKIFFVVSKEGNVVDLEIVAPSPFPIFDQTTIQAIRSSAPFPPLPAGFPRKRLEAYLVFEFHE